MFFLGLWIIQGSRMYPVLLFSLTLDTNTVDMKKKIRGFAKVFRTAFLQTATKNCQLATHPSLSLRQKIEDWADIRKREEVLVRDCLSPPASLPLTSTSAHLQGTQNISCPRHLLLSNPIFSVTRRSRSDESH